MYIMHDAPLLFIIFNRFFFCQTTDHFDCCWGFLNCRFFTPLWIKSHYMLRNSFGNLTCQKALEITNICEQFTINFIAIVKTYESITNLRKYM